MSNPNTIADPIVTLLSLFLDQSSGGGPPDPNDFIKKALKEAVKNAEKTAKAMRESVREAGEERAKREFEKQTEETLKKAMEKMNTQASQGSCEHNQSPPTQSYRRVLTFFYPDGTEGHIDVPVTDPHLR